MGEIWWQEGISGQHSWQRRRDATLAGAGRTWAGRKGWQGLVREQPRTRKIARQSTLPRSVDGARKILDDVLDLGAARDL